MPRRTAGICQSIIGPIPFRQASDFSGNLTAATSISSTSPVSQYKYDGKEWNPTSLSYDFGARNYLPAIPRWNSMDPLAEKYYSISPYVYCAGNPVNLVDRDGKETWVIKLDDRYEVIGGVLNDDLNIYEYLPDEDGDFTVRGESIGQTATSMSFYNSDKGEWSVRSKIDPNDNSGKDFLIKTKNASLVEYILKARNNHEWDFKVTGGTPGVKYDKSMIYRGMPISETQDGQPVYASARDVGNIAAGYVARHNGLSWILTRIGCDLYQSYVTSRNNHKITIDLEGPSTTLAQFYGWIKSGRSTWAKGVPR